MTPPPDAPHSRSTPWPRPRYAWYALAILVAAYAFAIVDHIAIGLLVESIKSDIHISDKKANPTPAIDEDADWKAEGRVEDGEGQSLQKSDLRRP